MARKKAIRIRCSDTELADWSTYATERQMTLTEWVRRAMQFCRAAETDGRLDLRTVPATERFANAETIKQALSEIVEAWQAGKRLIPPS